MSAERQTAKTGTRSSFGSIQVLIMMALFIALSIVLGKQLSLTVLMAGIFFGPLAGLTVGACADLIGCLLVGYAINPIITAGAASVGFISGLVYKNCFRTKPKLRLAASVGAAHVIGSMIIKSIGLRIYFGYPLQMVALRVPLYIVIGCAEGYIIYLLLRNKAFGRQLERMKDR